METFKDIVTIFGGITTISAVLVVLVKPIREWVMGDSAIKAGMKCQLRSDMLHTYYKNKDTQKIRQYEAENFEYSYKAYKALKGNSFIEKSRRKWTNGKWCLKRNGMEQTHSHFLVSDACCVYRHFPGC